MQKVIINKRFVAGNLQGLTYETEVMMHEDEIKNAKKRMEDRYVFKGLGSPYVIQSVVMAD